MIFSKLNSSSVEETIVGTIVAGRVPAFTGAAMRGVAASAGAAAGAGMVGITAARTCIAVPDLARIWVAGLAVVPPWVHNRAADVRVCVAVDAVEVVVEAVAAEATGVEGVGEAAMVVEEAATVRSV